MNITKEDLEKGWANSHPGTKLVQVPFCEHCKKHKCPYFSGGKSVQFVCTGCGG
jgi:hypothetical protein